MSNTVTLGGNPIEVSGAFPAKGDQAPAFSLVGNDLADVTLASLGGKRKILNIFPSIDTPTCATSVPAAGCACANTRLATTDLSCACSSLALTSSTAAGVAPAA